MVTRGNARLLFFSFLFFSFLFFSFYDFFLLIQAYTHAAKYDMIAPLPDRIQWIKDNPGGMKEISPNHAGDVRSDSHGKSSRIENAAQSRPLTPGPSTKAPICVTISCLMTPSSSNHRPATVVDIQVTEVTRAIIFNQNLDHFLTNFDKFRP